MIPNTACYWLKNVRVPVCVLTDVDRAIANSANMEGMALVDIKIVSEIINQIVVTGSVELENIPTVDLHGKQIWPCFVDVHTHLDKGHIWERSPNKTGTFQDALLAIFKDEETWTTEDIYRRIEFGLKCSYVHGTKAIRTHLDSAGKLIDINWDVFNTLKKAWEDRLILQGVSLATLDYYSTAEGEKLVNKVVDSGGILGGVAYINPDLEQQIERIFAIAKDRNLNLDFHVDETGEAESVCLYKIAEAALKYQFEGKIICGHCCSLAVQPQDIVQKTLELVKAANIGIVSLPMCNLYLQDRQYHPSELPKTPRWRGTTLVHELKQAGISVAFASDNCRDPFYGFGDHDELEVFKMAVRICHLDRPFQDWLSSVTKTPADFMGLVDTGRIGVGMVADFIIFQGRYLSEILSRCQSDRIVIRNGKILEEKLPDYSELDPLIFDNF
ncbi:MAG: cytosine deaminase [Planktothrix agardhii KL2]|jgi:cytosine deaminase|uniref:cytosine deaminase n=1 Tax=Planktothrix agardhii TaxID=1160 RepID=UPI001A1C2800|nr:cytosine deaminase [Planktothrix agardhii]MBG0747688.1 cytosine deaminase [Planktothrix agardhii KL2]